MYNNDLKRVRYENSPLIEVIFQLRFPTILSINSSLPADFQEQIRVEFPFFYEQLEQQNEFLINSQIDSAQIRKIGENKNYNFISYDQKSKVNLTPSCISISTRNYIQWEVFKRQIEFIIPLFESIYKPSFYTRIGLRYVDAITRSGLNLSEKKWTELIQPHILGMITQEYEDGIKSYVSEIEYETQISDVFSKSHFELVHVNNNPELSFLIDCDYFTQNITHLSEMNKVADQLHTASSHFIQTAITDELSKAMKPVEIKL